MAVDKVDDRTLGYHLAIDSDTLAEVDEVGRGVEAHFVAGFLEDGGEKMGDGAFAVGAGDMDAAEAALGVAEGGHEVEGGLDVGLVSGSADAVVHGQLGEHVIYCFLIGHFLRS